MSVAAMTLAGVTVYLPQAEPTFCVFDFSDPLPEIYSVEFQFKSKVPIHPFPHGCSLLSRGGRGEELSITKSLLGCPPLSHRDAKPCSAACEAYLCGACFPLPNMTEQETCTQ
ncbi:unnamed protein product [Lepidochelys olivacea]